MTESGTPATSTESPTSRLGPGLLLAATGVGVGDLVAAAVAGATHGFALAWAAVAGAVIKYAVTEGLARWQLATGQTVIEGWVRRLGPGAGWGFLAYLVIWSFVVGGALASACGLAAHALFPAVPIELAAAGQSLVAAAVVLFGGYRRLEAVVKVFVGVMFVAIVGAALRVESPLLSLERLWTEAALPGPAIPFAVAVIGGVGGSVTLLSYGYWIRERGWEGPGRLATVRFDLAIAYALTGLFGVAVTALGAWSLAGRAIEGAAGLVHMSEMLAPLLGEAGATVFLVGFWAAVFTSMLGVWQGVPYLYCDLLDRLRARDARAIDSRRTAYRVFLVWLAGPPLVLLSLGKPFAVIVAYAILGGLFMPFLCATLLYLNGRRAWVGDLRYRFVGFGAVGLALLLFGWLGYRKLVEVILQ